MGGHGAGAIEAVTRRAALPETHRITRRVFLTLLGLVYLCAFVSLWEQIHGLVGSGGVLPAVRLLEAATETLGAARFWRLPTLFWLWPSDLGLHVLCAGGALAALALTLGLAPRLAAGLAWLFYLSLVSIGGIFLGYQWDALLLEAGVLSIWLAAPQLRPRAASAAPVEPLAVWLLRFLLFKLMFLSGAVKLLSEDVAWRNFTAMNFHYWTQPLPSPSSWWIHQLPAWLHAAEAGGTFVLELLLPWLIFAPRPWRWLAFPGIAGLQLLIFSTGNYGFFNLLCFALAILVLDDAVLSRVPADAVGDRISGWSPRRRVFAAFAIAMFSLSLLRVTDRLQVSLWRPAPLVALQDATAQFHSVNAYGLFAVMTTRRDEIALEGSHDGQLWRRYAFRYKPGPPDLAPAWAGLHMPRLDWQLWFAALRGCRGAPWFHAFLERVLQGQPAVIDLLAENPFPERPPRYLRTPLSSYTFTALGARSWWRIQPGGAFCPVVELREGSLVAARPGFTAPGVAPPK
jgi:hypothetical protein